MLGLEHQPRFQAPFGYYDADVNRRRLTWSSRSQASRFSPERHRRLRDRRIRRRRRHHRQGALDGRVLGRRARTGPPAHRVAVRSRRVRHVHAEQERQQPGDAAADVSRHAADKAQKALALIYGRLVGGSNAHFTGNFWRLRPSDFNEASVLGGVPGTGLVDWPITYDELEPYYTKAEWELGVSGEPGPFDPPRSRPYPMPPLPVKSSGVLLEQRGAGARASPAADADGDQLPVLQRPARVPALRLLPVLHVRVPLEVDVDGDDAAAGGGDRPLRDPAGELRGARRDRSRRPRDRRGLLRCAEAAAAAARQSGRALRERRRDAAAAAQLRVVALSERPGQLERRGRQVPDVQHLLRRQRAVRASRSTSSRASRTPAWSSTSTTPIRSGDSTAAAASTRASANTRSRSRSADSRRDRRRGAKASRAVSPSSSRARCSSARMARRCRSRPTASRSTRRSRMRGACRACGSPTRITPTI